MSKFEKIISEYKSIKPDDEYKADMLSIIKGKNAKTRRRISIKLIYSAAACFLLVFVAIFNLTPNLAYAVKDIPVLSDIVRVVTFGRYFTEDNGYEANINIPKIEGLLDSEFEARLNNEFKENANELILAFENDVRELKKEYGEETVHMGVTSDYVVKTNNDKYLALDVYIVYTGGSSTTIHKLYTIDKTTGELLKLGDMFKEGSNYAEIITDYIKSEMKRMNDEENATFFIEGENIPVDVFEQLDENHNFYVNDNDEIVICFDKYEIAAGVQGSPEFIIPKNIVEKIIK